MGGVMTSVLVGIWKGPQQAHLIVLLKAIYVHRLEVTVPLLVGLLMHLDPHPLLWLSLHRFCLLLLTLVPWGSIQSYTYDWD